jgi:hypothetical protein
MTERRIAGGAQSPDTPPAVHRTNAMPAIIGAVIAAVLLVLGGGFFLTRAQHAATAPTAVPVATIGAATAPAPTVQPSPVPVTATPSGPDVRAYVDIVEEHIKAGRYREAVTTAEAALSINGVRAEDQRVLTGYIVSAGLKDIYTQPSRPLDRDGQQQLVDRYLSLVERAKGGGVPIDTPLQVAASAYAASQFPLTRVALEQAIAEGSFDPTTDRDTVRLYASALYGLGKWYTTAEVGSPLYEEGLRWLVTSDVVADRYETGQSEAESLLGQLGYTKRSEWPTPMVTPLVPEQEGA